MSGTKRVRESGEDVPTESVEVEAVPAMLANFDKLPDTAFVRLNVVAGLCSVSPLTVWRWARSGRLPAPVKLGPNTTVWRVGALRRALQVEA